MHELGVLMQAVKTVVRVAEQNHIRKVKHITLEVGRQSTYVPAYFEKLYPAVSAEFSVTAGSHLRMEMAPGRGLLIKDIGY